MTKFTDEELTHHAQHPGETYDDCPICWTEMTPTRFVEHQLDDVDYTQLLASDETSYLVGVRFTDGRKQLAIVYPPKRRYDLWDLELGDEVSRETPPSGTGSTPPPQLRCKLEADLPSPIEQILADHEPEDGSFTKGDTQ